tara:strand:+ start:2721 stop:3095 length:375 start_codon:yes stop_codon:yes gene_type:complete
MSKKKESHGKLGGNLEDVHMQEGYFSEKKIYERNKDTGVIRSRKPGDYGNERIEHPTQEDVIKFNQREAMDKVIHPLRKRIRAEALDELWAADKVNHEGHWYIRLTDVINIMGDYDDLYENESK